MLHGPFRLVTDSFPPMKKLKLMASPSCIPCFGFVHHHVVVGSTLPLRHFLVVYCIGQGDPCIVHGPMILQLLGGAVSEWVGGGVVGVAYLAPKGWAALAVSVHAIDRVHQPS